jgi:hypothetical protein
VPPLPVPLPAPVPPLLPPVVSPPVSEPDPVFVFLPENPDSVVVVVVHAATANETRIDDNATVERFMMSSGDPLAAPFGLCV